jgi:hypothetical protein
MSIQIPLMFCSPIENNNNQKLYLPSPALADILGPVDGLGLRGHILVLVHVCLITWTFILQQTILPCLEVGQRSLHMHTSV